MSAILALSLLVAASFPAGAAPADIAGLREPGVRVSAAPLPTILGGHLSLASASGRPTVLIVFASWCDPCLKNLPAIVRLSHETDARFVGIDALESSTQAKALVAKYNVHFPVVLLTSSEFERAGVTDEQRGSTGIDIPAVYVLDGHGVSFKAFAGPQAGNVAAIRSAIQAASSKK